MNDSILLVNGTVNPQINLPRQVVRLRLLNASQSRNFNFGFSGNIPISIIASDGGLLQAPVKYNHGSVYRRVKEQKFL
ncbi:MAG: hypothetical protein IPL69_19955 [Saprospiraceae bacterium]|nr:hypothetical protein [Candidatus Brachybacter algidus]